jgi:hypothetical protein
MNYFFSGYGTTNKDMMVRMSEKCPWRLLSCHDSYTPFAHQWCSLAIDHEVTKQHELLLDSGAFTAWTQGKKTSLNPLMRTYSDFINKYGDYFKHIWLINLDKIPGSPGRDSSAEEIEDAIVESDDNFNTMKKEFGDIVLPVFHQDETLVRLKEVTAMNEYICISPRNDLHEKQRVKWSQEVHKNLTRDTRTHGLATTGTDMMETVPWHSVDSTAWLMPGAWGGVVVLIHGKLKKISVSAESPNNHKMGAHFSTLTDVEKEVFLSRFDLYEGFTPEVLSSSLEHRVALSMFEIIEYVKQIDIVPVETDYLFPFL